MLPIIERCVKLMETQARERNTEIRIRAEDPKARATVDAKQLTQVLTNLFLNSLTAISEEGKIEVCVHRDGEALTIEVHDNGPGVAPDDREHVFEAFYTTRSEGTGLGLAVSRELVHGMGGRLDYLDSGPGATFVIHLLAQERSA